MAIQHQQQYVTSQVTQTTEEKYFEAAFESHNGS